MNLQSLPISRLVEIYNLHAERPIKKFRDKATAVARVEAVLPPKEETAEERIKWLCENPKKRGAAAERAAKYWGASTVDEYLSAGGTRADLSWDKKKNFIEVLA